VEDLFPPYLSFTSIFSTSPPSSKSIFPISSTFLHIPCSILWGLIAIHVITWKFISSIHQRSYSSNQYTTLKKEENNGKWVFNGSTWPDNVASCKFFLHVSTIVPIRSHGGSTKIEISTTWGSTHKWHPFPTWN